MGDSVPGLALLGAGTFALAQYVPKLGELAHLASVKVIWSRSQVEASFTWFNERQTLKKVEYATPYLLSFTERQLTALFDILRKNHNQRSELNRHDSRSKFLRLSARIVRRKACKRSALMPLKQKQSGERRAWMQFWKTSQSMQLRWSCLLKPRLIWPLEH